MNRGGLGARSLNVMLQQALNKNGEPSIVHFGSTFAPGDKIIQTVNNYDKKVFNGDIGQILTVDLEEGLLQAVSMAGRSTMSSVSLMRWLWPTPPASTIVFIRIQDGPSVPHRIHRDNRLTLNAVALRAGRRNHQ